VHFKLSHHVIAKLRGTKQLKQFTPKSPKGDFSPPSGGRGVGLLRSAEALPAPQIKARLLPCASDDACFYFDEARRFAEHGVNLKNCPKNNISLLSSISRKIMLTLPSIKNYHQ